MSVESCEQVVARADEQVVHRGTTVPKSPMFSLHPLLATWVAMRIRTLLPGLLGTFGFACGLFGADGSNQSPLEGDGLSEACQLVRSPGTINNGPLPEGCIKIEGGELGRTDLELDVGSGTVRITGWSNKDGEAGEYIGFTYETDLGGGFLSVKAGGESYRETYDGDWVHPNGTSGPTASGISNVVFCDGAEPPGDGDAPDPGDGDEGGSPDPCYPEDGDGSPDPGGDDGTPDDGSGDDGTPDDGSGDDGAPDDGSAGGDDSGDPSGGGGSTDPGGDDSACTHDDECDGSESCSAGSCIPAF